MFVVSVSDRGHERNIVASGIFLTEAALVIVSGDKRLEFRAEDLIEIVPVFVRSGGLNFLSAGHLPN